MLPLSLYIHFPWCIRKCPYCDFNSHAIKSDIPHLEYCNALIQDFDAQLSQVEGRTLISIFIGGGTPSLMLPQHVKKLLNHITTSITCVPDIEITLEANPGSLEAAKFKDFIYAGVNRLSIGIQSFNDEHLAKLGRIHNSDQAKLAIASAQNSGCNNINLDLMYALPQQSVKEASDDISQAIGTGVSHISYYQLTLEPNTVFYLQPPQLPHENESDIMFDQAYCVLEEEGYERYEVSAYATKVCQHNLNYWTFGDYLGIGAGACGKITTSYGIVRTRQQRSPKQYLDSMQSKAKLQHTLLSDKDVSFEFMLNVLRLSSGFSPALFIQRTGLSLDVIRRQLEIAQVKKLLLCTNNHIQPTKLGYNFLNDLQQIFLS